MKTIKIIVLSVTLLLGFALPAKADTSFIYTGHGAAWADDSSPVPTYDWSPIGNSSSLDIGGLSSEVYGDAIQFSVAKLTTITSLNVDATYYNQGSGSTTLVYQLFSGTATSSEHMGNIINGDVPSGGPVFTSNPLIFTAPFDEQGPVLEKNDINVPFNVTLEPGTYWIGDEGGRSVVVQTTQTYNTVPEPPTVVLFGLGLVLFLGIHIRFFVISSLYQLNHST